MESRATTVSRCSRIARKWRGSLVAAPAFVVLLIALSVVGCGGEATTTTPASAPEQTGSAEAPAGTGETATTPGESAGTTAGEGASDGSGGSATLADPSLLLTDEEAAAYFGRPAIHEKPAPLGSFVNVTYSPASGPGQTLVITTFNIGTLDIFEKQVQAEAEALGDTAQKVDGLGESAYFSAGTLKFFKNGGYYQIAGSDPKDGGDLLTALIPLATKMASRVP